MTPSFHDPRLREKYCELRRRHPDAGQGFICILDLRSGRRKVRSNPADRLIPWAILFSLAMIFTAMRIPTPPPPPLHLDADALCITGWKSPTAFLLAEDFQPTQAD